MTQDAPVSLAVVMPCHQEAGRIEAAFEGFSRLSETLDGAVDLVVVENGSTDGTGTIAQGLAGTTPGVRVIVLERPGKGRAVKAGILATSASWIVLADADWSMDPAEVLRLLPAGPGDMLRIASREHPSSVRLGEPWFRHVLGRAFNFLIRLVLLPGLQDTQCGFKGIQGDLAREIAAEMQETGWAFDVELLAMARRQGHSILEVPLTWRHDPDSRIRPIFHAVTMGLSVLRIAQRLGRIPAPIPERDTDAP